MSELISDRVNYYLTPLLVALGLVLNFLTIVVFCRQRMRKYIFSVSMISLAVFDSLVLAIPVLLTWTDEHFYDSYFINNTVWCNLHGYADLIMCANSSWLMILISLERWFAVCRPWEKTSRFTAPRLRLAILSHFCLSILLFVYFPLSLHITKISDPVAFESINSSGNATGMRIHYYECKITHEKIYDTMGTVSVLLVYVVPFFLLSVLNVQIIIGLQQRRFQPALLSNLKMLALNPAANNNNNAEEMGLQAGVKSSATKNNRHLSITIVVVACCNLIFTFPFQLFWFYENFVAPSQNSAMPADEDSNADTRRNLKNLTFIIKNTNYLINFVLYSALSKLFRQELLALIIEGEFYGLGAFLALHKLRFGF
jgi:hypothetical protein